MLSQSMTLTEQANQFSKTSYFNRAVRQHVPLYSSLKKEHPEILSFNVYLAQHPMGLTKPTKLHLPAIDKHDDVHRRKNTRPPMYRPCLRHVHSSQFTPRDLSQLTGRGMKTDFSAMFSEKERVKANEYHHAPPPSPSDEEIEHFFGDSYRARRTAPRLAVGHDGNVPYRLPALHPSVGRRLAGFPLPSKQIKSTLATHRQTFF